MSLILLKRLVLFLSALLQVLGLILIGYGILLLYNGNTYSEGLVIIIGFVIMIMAIFGFKAVKSGAPIRILVYLVAVVLLILTQLVFLVIVSHGTKDGISGIISDGFERLWEVERNKSGGLAYYENWLHCCGVNSSEDYWIIHHAIPSSCCLDNKCVDQSSVHKVGCKAAFTEYFDDKLLVFKIVCWILIIGEAVGAVLCCLLYSNLKNET